jgi:hypothetical protein
MLEVSKPSNKKGFFESRIFKGRNSFGLDAYIFQFLVI